MGLEKHSYFLTLQWYEAGCDC